MIHRGYLKEFVVGQGNKRVPNALQRVAGASKGANREEEAAGLPIRTIFVSPMSGGDSNRLCKVYIREARAHPEALAINLAHRPLKGTKIT